MSTEAFWAGVGAYNEATWALQAILIAIAVFLTYWVMVKPGVRTDLLAKGFFSIAFAWNGVVFFLIFLRNPISMFTGVPLFIALSILFAVDIFAKKTHFELPQEPWKRALTLIWIALVYLYPGIGLLFGHVYPGMLLPLFPCPLTVFTIALVAAAAPKVDRRIFILLLPWALLSLPKCFGAMDCYEDCILFAAGVYGLVELIRTWKLQPKVTVVNREAA
ncbi:MAG: hypothetical protein JXA42_14485 [Anaerolineales bacterium]|nr:hypothetical protein [Anaerolineales bacterium]